MGNPKISESRLIGEWDYDLNTLDPKEVSTGSDRKAWWKCPACNLSYDATVHTRFGKNPSNCPFCAKKRPSYFHNLEVLFPKIAKQFMVDRNNISPVNIMPKSHKKYWWKCEKDHVFKNTPDGMTRKLNKNVCKYCAGKEVWPGESVGDLFPNLLSELDQAKHPIDTLFNYTKGSNKKLHWVCNNGHRWQASIASRTRGRGCRKCKSPYTRPEIRMFSEVKYYYPNTRLRYKEDMIEFDVFIPELRLAIEYDGLVWHQKKEKSDRTKNLIAKKKGIFLLRVRDRLKPLEKTDIIANKAITLDIVKKIIKKIVKLEKSKSKISRLLEYDKQKHFINDLLYKTIEAQLPAPLYEHSFEYHFPDKAKLWDYDKNVLTPDLVTFGSTQKYWWLCKKEQHSFDATPEQMRVVNCPICHGKRITDENSLAGKFPKIANQWDPIKNQGLSPNRIAPHSREYVWWTCEKGHSYSATPNKRVSMGSGCPVCVGRTPETGNSFGDLYPKLVRELSKYNQKNIDYFSLPIGSHLELRGNCKVCKKNIIRQTRRWCKLYDSKSKSIFMHRDCASKLLYKNKLRSWKEIEDMTGLPASLLKGRLSHGKDLEESIMLGNNIFQQKEKKILGDKFKSWKEVESHCGLPKALLLGRIQHGKTLEEAIALGPDIRYKKKRGKA